MSEAIASPETRTNKAEQLADRYLALWNEAAWCLASVPWTR
jgi:hypothetical protein